jgi:hypothetical protein
LFHLVTAFKLVVTLFKKSKHKIQISLDLGIWILEFGSWNLFIVNLIVMKKIFSFLTTIAVLFVVYFVSFNDAMADETPADTAFYYNEHGTLLWQNPNAAKRESFVIKTSKSFNDIFDDIAQHDTTGISASYSPATVIHISRHTSKKVERLIRRGLVDDPLVTENILPVVDKTILCKMYNNIQARCANSDDDRNYKEHGGVLLPDGTVTCITGDISDPRTFAGAALLIKEKALVVYHSHPGGYVERNSGSYASYEEPNPNKVFFSGNTQREFIWYIQGPSRQDQEAIGKGTGYVFGMSSHSGLIYIYDSEGVKATLPVSFVKKAMKVRRSEVRKIDTYTAGFFSNIRLPYLF